MKRCVGWPSSGLTRIARATAKVVVAVIVIQSFNGITSKCQAQTSDTVVVNYSLYAPASDYKIELFEVGNPYPSRVDTSLHLFGARGNFTYKASWNYISRYRWYFLRVTDTRRGIVKQMGTYCPFGPVFTFPLFNWYYQ